MTLCRICRTELSERQPRNIIAEGSCHRCDGPMPAGVSSVEVDTTQAQQITIQGQGQNGYIEETLTVQRGRTATTTTQFNTITNVNGGNVELTWRSNGEQV